MKYTNIFYLMLSYIFVIAIKNKKEHLFFFINLYMTTIQLSWIFFYISQTSLIIYARREFYRTFFKRNLPIIILSIDTLLQKERFIKRRGKYFHNFLQHARYSFLLYIDSEVDEVVKSLVVLNTDEQTWNFSHTSTPDTISETRSKPRQWKRK